MPVTVSQFAGLLRVPASEIGKYIARGLPVAFEATDREPRRLDLADAIEWVVADRVKRAQTRDPKIVEFEMAAGRLTKARADERELRAAALRAEAIPVELARETWDSIVRAAELGFAPVADRFRRRFPDMPPSAVAELRQLIDEILDELRSHDGTERRTSDRDDSDPPEDDDGDDEAEALLDE